LKIACYQGGGKGYGFWGNVNDWNENLSISVISAYREATDKEVEEALLAYAKKKYPKGTTYNSLVNKSRVNESSGDLYRDGKGSFNRIIDRENGNLIFDQRIGFWAEIISTPVFDHKALLDQKQYIMEVDPVKEYPITPDEVYDFDYKEVSKVRVELIKVESIL
ncbi:MAG: hypothetical protein H5T96_09820, partial [Tissierellales bacterium]|nr:hypothetical protein [Tissierellales bacterium]